jgi:uncharacterized membrane-anchored protein YhcB (DUF1043 family)
MSPLLYSLIGLALGIIIGFIIVALMRAWPHEKKD